MLSRLHPGGALLWVIGLVGCASGMEGEQYLPPAGGGYSSPVQPGFGGNGPTTPPMAENKETSLGLSFGTLGRGAMVRGRPELTLEGGVTGTLAELADLTINGQPVAVANDGRFEVTLDSAWGVNVMVAEARAKNGVVVRGSRSYVWAPSYGRAKDEGAENVVVRLTDRILDDGDREDMDDFGSLAEQFMANTDLDGIVPENMVQGGMFMMSYSAKKAGRVETGKMAVSIKPIAGGLRMTGTAPWFRVPMRLSAGPMSVMGMGHVADMEFSADFAVSKTCGGSLSVHVARIGVTFGNITFDLGSGLPGNMMSSMIDMMTTFFRGTVRSNMERHMAGMLPQLMQGFIGSIAMPTAFVLPPELGGIKLPVSSSLCRVAFDQQGGIFGFEVASSAKEAALEKERGWPRFDPSTPTFEGKGTVFVGVQWNLLNQTLHAAWRAGALSRRLMPHTVLRQLDQHTLPIETTSFSVSTRPLLPPVVRPGNSAREVLLGLGDTEVELLLQLADGGQARIRAYLGSLVPAVASYSRGIVLKPTGGARRLTVDVLSHEGLSDTGAESARLFVAALVPSLAELLVSRPLATFRLPFIDASQLMPQMPQAPKIVMGQAQVDHAGTCLRVGGEMGIAP